MGFLGQFLSRRKHFQENGGTKGHHCIKIHLLVCYISFSNLNNLQVISSKVQFFYIALYLKKLCGSLRPRIG